MNDATNERHTLKRKAQDSDEEKEKKDKEKWKKRRQTCYRKLLELNTHCDADVYTLLHRRGEFFTLNTSDDPSFPLQDDTLVSLQK